MRRPNLLLLIAILAAAVAVPSVAVATDRGSRGDDRSGHARGHEGRDDDRRGHDRRGDDRRGHDRRGHDRRRHGGRNLPQTIALPNGFRPEGIASRHHTLYVGSIPTGAIFFHNLKTGEQGLRVQPQTGRAAIGIKVDKRNRLFVAGGPTGKAFVYDARTGADLAEFQLAPAGTTDTFVNDVVVTRRAAYFTDSRQQQLYVVPLGRRGQLPAQADVKVLPLTGDIQYQPGDAPNANGIEAAKGGRVLIIVQSNVGKLFTVNPRTGVTDEIDLRGGNVTNGDGLLLEGRRLYVVQNRDNRIAKVRLSRNLSRGTISPRFITDPDFDVPTTLTRAKGRLWAPNARFTTPPTPDTTYNVVRVG